MHHLKLPHANQCPAELSLAAAVVAAGAAVVAPATMGPQCRMDEADAILFYKQKRQQVSYRKFLVQGPVALC